MTRDFLPLKEVSVDNLFMSGDKCVYEIPIYQRNYAWGKDEISTLIQDVFDALKKNQPVYYIGTLVSFNKGDKVHEIIDGQQRLTTIFLILRALGIQPANNLAYRARKKSDNTLQAIPDFDIDERDNGIVKGYNCVIEALGEIVAEKSKEAFKEYFRSNVHIVHYNVPKDIDLNHYFEVMNSRGEQLEKHEIVKSKLMGTLNGDKERQLFSQIWQCCSVMNVYCQQNLGGIKVESIFGESLCDFLPTRFDDIISCIDNDTDDKKENTIDNILAESYPDYENEYPGIYLDKFQPIIDFPNFLLIVLKIVLLHKSDFKPANFNLDDKELLKEFDDAKLNAEGVKAFAFHLLKARYLLDNYIVHHSCEEDTIDSNPWKLQRWNKDRETKKGISSNLCHDMSVQNRLTQVLSMFEVSFTARQRKNYLFYCLVYLIQQSSIDTSKYAHFVERLADCYFDNVYMASKKLNTINTPVPGSFDEVMLSGNTITYSHLAIRTDADFVSIYGDGTTASRGVPLFVFNYMDYKLWHKYNEELRGNKLKEGSSARKVFFESLGCSDMGLDVFDKFYFSRTRRSLEHYFPQANATGKDGNPDRNQINCFGNYAMIGSEINSLASNWSPKTKLDHYLDSSGKINQFSVASLKFAIMMRCCKDKEQWTYEDFKAHQQKMVPILLKPFWS